MTNTKNAAKAANNKTRNVFWFSRHEMTEDQKKALGDNVVIHQCNQSVKSAYEIADKLEGMDVIAIVAPVNLQQQFLRLAGGRPVIMAVSERVLISQEEGEDKVEFHFVKWERLLEINIVKEDYRP